MAARCPVTATRIGVIRSGLQHQEERSIGFVSGGGSAAFRAQHDDTPFGRANAPPVFATALVQHDLKDGKLIR
jgi:hypothetical protein